MRETAERLELDAGGTLETLAAQDLVHLDRTGEIVVVEVDRNGQLAPARRGRRRRRERGAASPGAAVPVLNVFASEDNGKRWVAGRPDVRGSVMGMDEAIEAGRAVFGDVLASPTSAELPSAP